MFELRKRLKTKDHNGEENNKDRDNRHNSINNIITCEKGRLIFLFKYQTWHAGSSLGIQREAILFSEGHWLEGAFLLL